MTRNKKALVQEVEHNHYIPVVASLFIWFIIAWSVRQPGFQKNDAENTHGAPTVQEARDLPTITTNDITETEPTDTVLAYGEFQDLLEPTPTPEEVERNSKLPRPEIFVKTVPTEGGYVLSFSTNNFVVGTDGYLVLTQDGNEKTKIYASPYFLAEDIVTASTDMNVMLVNPKGAIIKNDWSVVSEHLSF
jgi:hypothetical protein